MEDDVFGLKKWVEAWRAAISFGRWLEHTVDLPYNNEVRDAFTDDVWYWSIPDFANGRSKILAIKEDVLRNVALDTIISVLNNARWLEHPSGTSTVVEFAPDGALRLQPWRPLNDEAWFNRPGVGYFVATIKQSHHPPPFSFVLLVGEFWSAMGPTDPHDLQWYTAEELEKYIPNSAREH